MLPPVASLSGRWAARALCVGGEAEVSTESLGPGHMLVGTQLEPRFFLWSSQPQTRAYSFGCKFGVICFHILLRDQAFRVNRTSHHPS